MGNPHRDRPLREKQPKRKVEEDADILEKTKALFPVPPGSPEFRDGYRECIELYAINRPRKRGVKRILDGHRLILEEACMRAMTRENVARYEGFRQAMKALPLTPVKRS